MALARINEEQYEHLLDYLTHTSGVDLQAFYSQALLTDDKNPAKVIAALELISKSAREVAQYLREGNEL